MTVNREAGEGAPMGRPPSPGVSEGPPAAGGGGGGAGGQDQQQEAPSTSTVVEQDQQQQQDVPPCARTDQEAVDTFPTAKLTKLDELISNPR